MTLLASYAVWNNKGGVGKSTITFHLATRYAELHPTRKVLVVDMCPQANASMMLLGGGEGGEDEVLARCLNTPLPQTVVGYIAAVLSGGPGAPLPPWYQFVVNITRPNAGLAGNIFLLSGDGNLEPMAPLISEQASQRPLTAAANPWRWVHLVIRSMIDDVSAGADEWVVFIDTNPSFGIYTEMAISAADRLLVPVNADDASRMAVRAMMALIYGQNPPHPFFGAYTYASRATQAGIQRPVVDLIIGNRLTQHQGPAAAFAAMSDATADALFQEYQSNPARFVIPAVPVATTREFRDAFSVPLRDFNTAGVVAAHLGVPLSQLPAGYHLVHGEPVQVNDARVRECRQAVDNIVARLV